MKVKYDKDIEDYNFYKNRKAGEIILPVDNRIYMGYTKFDVEDFYRLCAIKLNRYGVSNLGKVYSCYKELNNMNPELTGGPESTKKAKNKEVTRKNITKKVYLNCYFDINGNPGYYLPKSAHQLVAHYFCDNRLNKKDVHHIDIDPKNNCADNLIYVYNKDDAATNVNIENQHKKCHDLAKNYGIDSPEYKDYIKSIREENKFINRDLGYIVFEHILKTNKYALHILTKEGFKKMVYEDVNFYDLPDDTKKYDSVRKALLINQFPKMPYIGTDPDGLLFET